jgi:hypothetical protein
LYNIYGEAMAVTPLLVIINGSSSAIIEENIQGMSMKHRRKKTEPKHVLHRPNVVFFGSKSIVFIIFHSSRDYL